MVFDDRLLMTDRGELVLMMVFPYLHYKDQPIVSKVCRELSNFKADPMEYASDKRTVSLFLLWRRRTLFRRKPRATWRVRGYPNTWRRRLHNEDDPVETMWIPY